jgi:sigma-B regulation protein RsbU (phosphoserine phosphatase)
MFLYTDGLTEAKNSQRKQFGLQRVQELLTRCTQEKKMPREIIETTIQEVHAFVMGAEPSDDLTLLAIHYMPQHFESILSETLTLKNDVRETAKLSSFMKSITEKLELDKSLARQLRLAVEEAVVNVIDYAYPVGIEGDVTIKVMSDNRCLKVIIVDSGVAFDPTAKEKTDITLSAEERQIGGLGILLVRELMDTINYERTDGQNILTLMKLLSNKKQ